MIRIRVPFVAGTNSSFGELLRMVICEEECRVLVPWFSFWKVFCIAALGLEKVNIGMIIVNFVLLQVMGCRFCLLWDGIILVPAIFIALNGPGVSLPQINFRGAWGIEFRSFFGERDIFICSRL